MVDVFVISFMTSLHNCCIYVVREIWLHYDLVMKVFFEVLCALITTMTIINSKNLDFGPVLLGHFWLFQLWLDDVQDNGDTVFVGFSN